MNDLTRIRIERLQERIDETSDEQLARTLADEIHELLDECDTPAPREATRAEALAAMIEIERHLVLIAGPRPSRSAR